MNDAGINDAGINDSRAAGEPTRQRRQIHEIEQKPGILSGCLTPAGPAVAPQVIEKKHYTSERNQRDPNPTKMPSQPGIS
jgi:hypothetical protein